MWTIAKIRQAYLDYFVEKGHTLCPSVPLLPKGDPTLLFVNSGMVPFKEVFRGLETRPYKRATSCQKSLRVAGKHNDYEQIGQTARHHTFFEMLGNFSLGDYFKREAIGFAWEFVTERLKMDKSKLWITVHHNDKEAEQLWQEIAGVPAERIVQLGDDSNQWVMGDFGPRGYCSEIFYYVGTDPSKQSREEFLKDDGTYLEFWNLVFMQFNRNQDGSVTPLPRPCIDTGMGLERIGMILQGVKSNYDTDLLRGLIAKAESISGKTYEGSSYLKASYKDQSQWERDVAMRVIADHARSIAFLIADGVAPSNEREGYVLRRLIRRTMRHGETIGIQRPFITEVTDEVERYMAEAYPELREKRARIHDLINQEEAQFRHTLSSGMKLLEKAAAPLKRGEALPGAIVFELYDTHGFPADLTADVLKERGITIDLAGFEKLMEGQRDRSRGAQKFASAVGSIKELKIEGGKSEFVGYERLVAETTLRALQPGSEKGLYFAVCDATPFYPEMGGQVGDQGTLRLKGMDFEVIDTQKTVAGQIVHVLASPEQASAQDLSAKLVGEQVVLSVDPNRRARIARHHSGTHLLGAALRKVLGSQAEQRGSLVNDEKLRFDFAQNKAVTEDQLAEIKGLIQEQILGNYEVECQELPIDEAKKRGAMAVFGEKYGEVVRVVSMGPLSMELCGGTHVERTGDIGLELVVSESGIATGVRRIEALCAEAAFDKLEEDEAFFKRALALSKGPRDGLLQRMEGLYETISTQQKSLAEKDALIAELLCEQLGTVKPAAGSVFSAEVSQNVSKEVLTASAERLQKKFGAKAVALAHKSTGTLVLSVDAAHSKQADAGKVAKLLATSFGGKGGGRPTSAVLVQIPAERMPEALKLATQNLT